MRTDRRGFALLTVLWLLVVIGGVAAVFQRNARAERLAAANAVIDARGRWAARAGLALGLDAINAALSSGGLSTRAGGDDLLPAFDAELEGAAVHVTIRDLRAGINLNTTDSAQLGRLFTVLGVEAADQLAATVLAWRQRRRAAANGTAKDSLPPFDAVERLAQVDGITPGVYRLVAAYVVAGGDGRVNVNTAPALVLLTLPGMDAPGVRALVARRSTRAFGNAFEVLAALPRETREAVQKRVAEFSAAVAFGPRDAAIVARAGVAGAPLAAQARATVHLLGGIRWEVERIVER